VILLGELLIRQLIQLHHFSR
jgi:hypothetical protein